MSRDRPKLVLARLATMRAALPALARRASRLISTCSNVACGESESVCPAPALARAVPPPVAHNQPRCCLTTCQTAPRTAWARLAERPARRCPATRSPAASGPAAAARGARCADPHGEPGVCRTSVQLVQLFRPLESVEAGPDILDPGRSVPAARRWLPIHRHLRAGSRNPAWWSGSFGPGGRAADRRQFRCEGDSAGSDGRLGRPGAANDTSRREHHQPPPGWNLSVA